MCLWKGQWKDGWKDKSVESGKCFQQQFPRSWLVKKDTRNQSDICLKHNYFSSSAGLRLCCVAVMAFPWLNGEDRPVSHAKTPIVECRNRAYFGYSDFFSAHTGFAHCWSRWIWRENSVSSLFIPSQPSIPLPCIGRISCIVDMQYVWSFHTSKLICVDAGWGSFHFIHFIHERRRDRMKLSHHILPNPHPCPINALLKTRCDEQTPRV